jgi:acylphosphatase
VHPGVWGIAPALMIMSYEYIFRKVQIFNIIQYQRSMDMTRKRLQVKGQKVHDVGYRTFLLGLAESLEIERFFADNIFIEGKQAVYAIIDSSGENVRAFIEIASSKFPENSDVEKVEAEDFTGNVMKTESYYRYLTAMQLSRIATYGGNMLEKQDRMLEKQDTTIRILERVSEDTSDMKSTLSRIEVDVKDTKFSLSSFIKKSRFQNSTVY